MQPQQQQHQQQSPPHHPPLYPAPGDEDQELGQDVLDDFDAEDDAAQAAQMQQEDGDGQEGWDFLPLDSGDEEEGQPPRRLCQRVSDIKAHFDGALHHQSVHTVRSFLEFEINHHTAHNHTDASMKERMAEEAKKAAGQDGMRKHHVPVDIEDIRAILGCKRLWEMSYHICVGCNQHFWQPLNPRLWRSPNADVHHVEAQRHLIKCPVPGCNGERFTKKSGRGVSKAVMEPKRVVYYMGLKDGLALPNYRDPLFTANQGHHRTPDDPSTPTGCLKFKQINQRLRGQLEQCTEDCRHTPHQTAPIELGYDDGNMFVFADGKIGVLAARYTDLPLHLMAKREWHRVLMLVPTDNEASNPGRLDGCMLPLFVDLIKYGPEMEAADYDKLPEHLRRLVSRSEAGIGMRLHPVHRNAQGLVQAGKSIQHRVVVTGIYADSMARTALCRGVSVGSSYKACRECDMQAVSLYGTRRWCGACVAVRRRFSTQKNQYNRLGWGENDTLRWLTPNEKLQRDEAVDADAAQSTVRGSHGVCMFNRVLYYHEYDDMFVLPFAHAVFRGILRDFWTEVIRSPQSVAKQQAAAVVEQENAAPAGQAVAGQDDLDTDLQDLPEAVRGMGVNMRDGALQSHIPRTINPAHLVCNQQQARRGGRQQGGAVRHDAYRSEAARRGDTFAMTNDWGSPYRDLFTQCQSWKIEEWMRFVEVVQPLMFVGNVPTDSVRRACMHLHQYIVYHMYVHPMPAGMDAAAFRVEREGRIKEAHEHLMQYAELVEREFGADLLTHNLHMLACWHHRQVLEWGDTAYQGELWLEQCIQYVKRKTKYRAVSAPARVIANNIELLLKAQMHLSAGSYDVAVALGEVPGVDGVGGGAQQGPPGLVRAAAGPELAIPAGGQRAVLHDAARGGLDIGTHGHSVAGLCQQVLACSRGVPGALDPVWAEHVLPFSNRVEARVCKHLTLHDTLREEVACTVGGQETSRSSTHVLLHWGGEKRLAEVRYYVELSVRADEPGWDPAVAVPGPLAVALVNIYNPPARRATQRMFDAWGEGQGDVHLGLRPTSDREGWLHWNQCVLAAQIVSKVAYVPVQMVGEDCLLACGYKFRQHH